MYLRDITPNLFYTLASVPRTGITWLVFPVPPTQQIGRLVRTNYLVDFVRLLLLLIKYLVSVINIRLIIPLTGHFTEHLGQMAILDFVQDLFFPKVLRAQQLCGVFTIEEPVVARFTTTGNGSLRRIMNSYIREIVKHVYTRNNGTAKAICRNYENTLISDI